MESYETLGVVGEGTYGVVLKARHRATGQLVAIKKFKQAEDDSHVRKTSLREVKVLKQLHHPNVISLVEVFRRDGKLYLVFEYIENTILQLLEATSHGLKSLEVKKFMYQLLRGIDYCHAHSVIHRDVKPENILVSREGLLKVCDFGFARHITTRGKYTDYVATRWYRAPELLVGDVAYGKGVDVWAMGCILAELSDSQPLFPGDSDLDQLAIILRTCGPVPENMVKTFERNPLYRRVPFPHSSRGIHRTLQQRYPRQPPEWMEFLTACLHTDPLERPSCAELMNLSYFTKDNFRVEYEAELQQLAATAAPWLFSGNVAPAEPASTNPNANAKDDSARATPHKSSTGLVDNPYRAAPPANATTAPTASAAAATGSTGNEGLKKKTSVYATPPPKGSKYGSGPSPQSSNTNATMATANATNNVTTNTVTLLPDIHAGNVDPHISSSDTANLLTTTTNTTTSTAAAGGGAMCMSGRGCFIPPAYTPSAGGKADGADSGRGTGNSNTTTASHSNHNNAASPPFPQLGMLWSQYLGGGSTLPSSTNQAATSQATTSAAANTATAAGGGSGGVANTSGASPSSHVLPTIHAPLLNSTNTNTQSLFSSNQRAYKDYYTRHGGGGGTDVSTTSPNKGDGGAAKRTSLAMASALGDADAGSGGVIGAGLVLSPRSHKARETGAANKNTASTPVREGDGHATPELAGAAADAATLMGGPSGCKHLGSNSNDPTILSRLGCSPEDGGGDITSTSVTSSPTSPVNTGADSRLSHSTKNSRSNTYAVYPAQPPDQPPDQPQQPQLVASRHLSNVDETGAGAGATSAAMACEAKAKHGSLPRTSLGDQAVSCRDDSAKRAAAALQALSVFRSTSIGVHRSPEEELLLIPSSSHNNGNNNNNNNKNTDGVEAKGLSGASRSPSPQSQSSLLATSRRLNNISNGGGGAAVSRKRNPKAPGVAGANASSTKNGIGPSASTTTASTGVGRAMGGHKPVAVRHRKRKLFPPANVSPRNNGVAPGDTTSSSSSSRIERQGDGMGGNANAKGVTGTAGRALNPLQPRQPAFLQGTYDSSALGMGRDDYFTHAEQNTVHSNTNITSNGSAHNLYPYNTSGKLDGRGGVTGGAYGHYTYGSTKEGPNYAVLLSGSSGASNTTNNNGATRGSVFPSQSSTQQHQQHQSRKLVASSNNNSKHTSKDNGTGKGDDYRYEGLLTARGEGNGGLGANSLPRLSLGRI